VSRYSQPAAFPDFPRHLLSSANDAPGADAPTPPAEDSSRLGRVKQLIFGPPRNLNDRSLFRHLSLAAFLAWVGLGADGLSSSCYGPAEAFRHLKGNIYLAVPLALATIVTVLIISACYRHIIEEFPSGGGGYVVASKLLGRHAGVLSGCALLVDYVLTITVSVAAAGEALFGLLPDWIGWKLPAEVGVIVVLILLNLRGVKESVTVLLPIFLLFLFMHAVLLIGVVAMNAGQVPTRAHELYAGVREGWHNPELGLWGMFVLLLYAYSLGAGTYTGIEAVSNSMPVMREPRVQTGQQTMRLMAWSLSLVAGGLILAYLLVGFGTSVVAGQLDAAAQLAEAQAFDRAIESYQAIIEENPGSPSAVLAEEQIATIVLANPGLQAKPSGATAAAQKTMNHRLADSFFSGLGLPEWLGYVLVMLTIVSEGALLVVASQAGFIDGPRVLANMALDSWTPHWFSNLSERLTTHNGVLLMGAAGLAALWFTHGNVSTLVLMYSINVFVTFSLSMVAMCRLWWQRQENFRLRRQRLALFGLGAAMCLSILCVTVVEKFTEGGWITLAVTGACVAACLLIHAYYGRVRHTLRQLDEQLMQVIVPPGEPNRAEPDPNLPTAVVLVGGYNGLGIHTMLTAVNFVPGHFRNVVFMSVGIVDSGSFKGANSVDKLRLHTHESLAKYVDLAQRFGFAATSFASIGTDVVDELEGLCLTVAKQFPKARFFAGQLMFQKDTWYQHLLHNYTAFALQRRLHWRGLSTVIVPTRIFEPTHGLAVPRDRRAPSRLG
jgi:amino acid transporter